MTPRAEERDVSEMARHTPGAEVFLEDGRVAEYLAAIPEGHLVRPLYEGEDAEPYFGRTITVHTVFKAPPVPKYDEATRAAQANYDIVQAKLDAARAELAAFEREERGRQARLKRHGALQTLDNLLAGKITHLVSMSYGDLRIETVEQAATDGSWGSLRALYLSGTLRGGEARWSIEDRCPGVYPCVSEHEARATAERLIMAEFEKGRGDRPQHISPAALVASCRRHGITPPADFAEKVRAAEEAAADDEVRRAERALKVATVRRAALTNPASHP